MNSFTPIDDGSDQFACLEEGAVRSEMLTLMGKAIFAAEHIASQSGKVCPKCFSQAVLESAMRYALAAYMAHHDIPDTADIDPGPVVLQVMMALRHTIGPDKVTIAGGPVEVSATKH